MSVEKQLYTRLSTYTPLTAIVSNRIYPVKLPQNVTLPAVSYFRVSTDRHSAMGEDIADVTSRFQVSAWGQTYTSVRSIADVVRAALERYSVNGADATIVTIFYINEQDLYEDDLQIYQLAMDFRIHYEE